MPDSSPRPLADARARVAAYAPRRSLLGRPVSRAPGVLRGVPPRKITAAEEVVRLVGEMPGEGAYAWLLDWTSPRRIVRRGRACTVMCGWRCSAPCGVVRSGTRRGRSSTTWPGRPTPPSPPQWRAFRARRCSPAPANVPARLLAALLAYPDPRVQASALGRRATRPLGPRGAIL